MTRRTVAAGMLGLAAALLLPAPAQAHPLGNFTTNQYAGLRISASGVDIDYVLDLAELPAYQTVHEQIDTDTDGSVSAAENTAWAGSTCATAAAAGSLAVDGSSRRVTARPAGLTFPPGAGGLTTLRLQCILHADARLDGEATVTYRSTLFADRVGWREITAVGDRYTVVTSNVPADSVSARLTAYPKNAATADARTATVTVRPGGPAAAPAPFTTTAGTQARDVDRFTAWFTDLVGHPRLTLGVGLLAFLIAVILGSAHAVAPGHGKTIMAAYLIGSRGKLTQALTVAGAVAATHTVGVLVLGIVLATSLQLTPATMYEWLRLAGGILIAMVGAQLLIRAIRINRAHTAAHAPHAAHTQADVPHGHGSHAHADHAEGHAHIGALAHANHAHAHAEPHAHADHAHAEAHAHADHAHAETHAHADHAQIGAHADHAHAKTHAHADHAHAETHAHADHALVGAHAHADHDHAEAHVHHDHAEAHVDHAHGAAPVVDVAQGQAGRSEGGHDAPVLAGRVTPHHDHDVPDREAVMPVVHSHGGRAHTHLLPAPNEPFKLRTLLAMGFAGGLSPSPSAVVVLLGAAALGRAWYGVLLVLAYGIGLAATLTGIGFALAHWGERLHRLSAGRWSNLLTLRMPAATATVILVVGLGMTVLATSGLLHSTFR